MNLNDINALCIMLVFVIIVFISITMDFKDNKIKKCNTNVNKKDMPLTCPEYCGVSCVNGTCPKANQEEYEEYGIPVVRTCSECSYYRGCEDCTEYGCDSTLKRLYCKK